MVPRQCQEPKGRSGDIQDPISSSRQSPGGIVTGTSNPGGAIEADLSSEAAFRALYQHHYRSVLAYVLRRCRDDSDAQDALAETFIVAWRRLDRLPDGDHASLLWLYGVARRVLANQRRGTRRRDQLVKRLSALPRPVHVAVDSVSDPRLDIVEGAMAELRPRDREILLLAAWERLSHAEIATVLGCSENASAIRFHRARQRLIQLAMKDDTSPRTTTGYRRPNAEEGLS
jgi:RNA polymerase sigma-70 factor (ECF subfamily)